MMIMAHAADCRQLHGDVWIGRWRTSMVGCRSMAQLGDALIVLDCIAGLVCTCPCRNRWHTKCRFGGFLAFMWVSKVSRRVWRITCKVRGWKDSAWWWCQLTCAQLELLLGFRPLVCWWKLNTIEYNTSKRNYLRTVVCWHNNDQCMLASIDGRICGRLAVAWRSAWGVWMCYIYSTTVGIKLVNLEWLVKFEWHVVALA